MAEDDNTVVNWLAENPKMTGVLFTAMLLLSQAGTVAAGGGTSVMGP